MHTANPTPAPPTRSRRRNPPGQGSRLREDIVDAAVRVLAGGTSPSLLSLRAVAKEAGITAPAIYPHFAGMDELLAAVVSRRFSDFSATLRDAADGAPEPRTPLALLRARTLAYCSFGLERPGDYELLFGRGEAHGGVPYANSAGQTAFADLVEAVALARPDADATAISTVLWPAMHGLVYARTELSGFPWPDLSAQVERLLDGLVVRAPSDEPLGCHPCPSPGMRSC